MFTFLQIKEIDGLIAPGKNPNEATERLAWEITALIHGKTEADKAMAGARAAFGTGERDRSAMPRVELPRPKFDSGYNVVDLFCDAKLAASKSEGRRLVQQGGAFVSTGDGELKAIDDAGAFVDSASLDPEGELILRAGKKRYCLVAAR
jgi:tyrosyl-tRNA synthetase